MNSIREAALSKVPQVILGFWIIKIAATTLGETGGDALSMTMNLGYVALRPLRRSARRWRIMRIALSGSANVGGSLILFVMLMLVLVLWRYVVGSVSVNNITSAKAEIFYWAAILFSNTLGTAHGDSLADTPCCFGWPSS
jgi:uncharacterized membrane-anchored protein